MNTVECNYADEGKYQLVLDRQSNMWQYGDA